MNDILHRMRFQRDHRWAPGRMSAFLDAELESGAQARMERHVNECPECRGVLNSLRRMLGLLNGLAPGRAESGTLDIVAAVRARLHERPSR